MQFQVSRPPGSRVRSLSILCTDCRVPRYQPVEDTAVYTVAVPGYLVSGGDGYAVIAEEMIKHDSGEASLGRFWRDQQNLHLWVFSLYRRLGHFRRVPLRQPTPAGFSCRGRTHPLPQLCVRTGTQPDTGLTGIAGAAVARLRGGGRRCDVQ